MSNKTSLILEGGGMRGLYTAGILDYFLEKGLEFDSVYGASAGCLNGANLVSRQKGRNLAIFTDYQNHPDYRGFKVFLKTGDYFNAKFSYEDIPYRLNPFDFETFENSKTILYTVVTNVETGKAEYIPLNRSSEKMQYFRASASLPLISQIVAINGKKYLDGGISDSIPLEQSIKDGHDKNIVILTRHQEYRKGPNKAMALVNIAYRKYPLFCQTMKNRHTMYNKQTLFASQMEKTGKAFVICPQQPLNVDRLESDKDKLKAIYDIGYKQAEQLYPQLIKYLSK